MKEENKNDSTTKSETDQSTSLVSSQNQHVMPSKPAIAATEQTSKETVQNEPANHPVSQHRKPTIKASQVSKRKSKHHRYKGSKDPLIIVTVVGTILGGIGFIFGISNSGSLSEMQKNQRVIQTNFLREVVEKENHTLQLKRRIVEADVELTNIQRRNVSKLLRRSYSSENRSKSNDEQLRKFLGKIAKSCSELSSLVGKNKSGVYHILAKNHFTKPVYCDLETGEGEWTVIQKRVDAKIYFSKSMSDYTTGFGDTNGSYFLGLENINRLTERGNHSLRVDLENFDGDKAYAKYSSFSVGNSSTSWELEISGYTGTAGDSMLNNNGAKFSTFDEDNDGEIFDNCALFNFGGWWYTDCGDSNLNGRYVDAGGSSSNSIYWKSWSPIVSIKKAEMKIRPA